MKHPNYSGGPGPGDDTGGGGGGGGGGGNDDVCLNIFERRLLNSPNPAVVGSLTVGTKLLVEAKGSALEIRTAAGAMCGTVISDVAEIIRCMSLKHSYVAIVMSISAGKCQVEIRHQ